MYFSRGWVVILADKGEAQITASLASKWFDFVEWITITGAIYYLANQTKDSILFAITFISYYFIYSSLIDLIIPEANKLVEPYIENRKQMLVTKIAISVLVLILLIGIYFYIDNLITKLHDIKV